MPVNPTYPGVYIEEIPSGVRTLIGVATSITAFVGRALRGPVDEPVTINNFGDFERIFGGLWIDSTASYAIRDFYRNGGSQAIVVRVFNDDGGSAVPLADYEFGSPVTLTLEAAYPGSWGNNLELTVDHNVNGDAAPAGFGAGDLFNLTVTDTATGVTEVHRNLLVADVARRIDRVLAAESDLVRVSGALPTSRPNVEVVNVPATFADDGVAITDTEILGSRSSKTGIYALEDADLFNMLVIPPYTLGSGGDIDNTVWTDAAAYCAERRSLLMVDAPSSWNDKDDAKSGIDAIAGAVGSNRKNAALFFPRLRMPNPLMDNQLESFAPSGSAAGVFARTDSARGVWKAPAGLEANLNGVTALSVPLTDDENGELNPLGINCLRVRPASGPVIWGSRTLDGNDQLASEWKYVPVRRLALFLEESLYRGTQWVVFEPNDEPLWAQIRLNLGAFMQSLFRQGAFQGSTPQEAYFVKVDNETTTQNDIDRGIVNIVVGFAPLKPAEFVIIQFQQIAGQTEV